MASKEVYSRANLILASALAVDPEISDVLGLEVERRSTLRDKKGTGTPMLETQICIRYPDKDVSS